MFKISIISLYTTPTPFPHLFLTLEKYMHKKFHGKKTNKTEIYFKNVESDFLWKNINPILPNVPFWSLWKHQKTKGFLIFSGGSKGNIGKKRVNRTESGIKYE